MQEKIVQARQECNAILDYFLEQAIGSESHKVEAAI